MTITTTNYSDTIQFTKWWLKSATGNEQVLNAFREFVAQIKKDEPETLGYLIYRPNIMVPNQPTLVPTELFFIECYASEAAFNQHVATFTAEISTPYQSSFYPYEINANEPLVLIDHCARYRPKPVLPPSGFIRPNGFVQAQITQYAKWWVKPEKDKQEVLNALYEFSIWVKQNEPGTLMYLFTDPEPGLTSPPAALGEIDFVAAYLSEQAQQLHYDNWNERFMSKYKDYFVVSCNDPNVPFIIEQNLRFFDGFVREENWL